MFRRLAPLKSLCLPRRLTGLHTSRKYCIAIEIFGANATTRAGTYTYDRVWSIYCSDYVKHLLEGSCSEYHEVELVCAEGANALSCCLHYMIKFQGTASMVCRDRWFYFNLQMLFDWEWSEDQSHRLKRLSVPRKSPPGSTCWFDFLFPHSFSKPNVSSSNSQR